jgi:hypothetical protein
VSFACLSISVEILDAKGASCVSVTQQFNTTSSMGRLSLNLPHKFDFIEFIFHPMRRGRPIASLDGSRVE